MGNNVEALKNLYKAFGGQLTDTYSDIAGGIPVSQYSLSADVINACAKKAPSGGGAELPEVSGANNGQVLTVVEGEWAAAAIPSQLPAVTASDEGSVLKVNAEGKWDVGTDEIQA